MHSSAMNLAFLDPLTYAMFAKKKRIPTNTSAETVVIAYFFLGRTTSLSIFTCKLSVIEDAANALRHGWGLRRMVA